MKIKQFYLNNYPTDELGIELKDDTNFTGLLNELFTVMISMDILVLEIVLLEKDYLQNFQRY